MNGESFSLLNYSSQDLDPTINCPYQCGSIRADGWLKEGMDGDNLQDGDEPYGGEAYDFVYYFSPDLHQKNEENVTVKEG